MICVLCIPALRIIFNFSYLIYLFHLDFNLVTVRLWSDLILKRVVFLEGDAYSVLSVEVAD